MIERETAPEWLGPETRFGPDLLGHLLDERVVFYPGAGDDFHPLEIFGKTGEVVPSVWTAWWPG